MKFVTFLKDNPVVLMDLVKAVLALVVVFGLPIPPGLDVAVAGAIVAALTVVTRSLVMPVGKAEGAIREALNTPVPAEGESFDEILSELDAPEDAPEEDATAELPPVVPTA
ncbi:hypothetical protein [Catellatospora sichuanensis]|uniref:hypothetical protein n=1 Tax=Catellatospora sichuanensis TaxID=1969805 RepID=UPI001183C4F6|nr:hypothetical protein [Catellatospora sichuanensis]